MAEKINALTIIEMMGRPKEHLKETLIGVLNKIGTEQGIALLNKKIHEPKKVKDVKNEIFTTFAEIELEFDSFARLVTFIFSYMPSHIEIVKPENISVSNYDLNVLGNELVKRLHQYDSIAKIVSIERDNLKTQLEQLMVPDSFPQGKPEKKKSSKKRV